MKRECIRTLQAHEGFVRGICARFCGTSFFTVSILRSTEEGYLNAALHYHFLSIFPYSVVFHPGFCWLKNKIVQLISWFWKFLTASYFLSWKILALLLLHIRTSWCSQDRPVVFFLLLLLVPATRRRKFSPFSADSKAATEQFKCVCFEYKKRLLMVEYSGTGVKSTFRI